MFFGGAFVSPRFAVPRLVLQVAERLRADGGEAFLVGGAVRDSLLRRPTHDFDLATNLKPEEVLRRFPFTVPTGLAHGTVSVWMNRQGEGPGIEVTTYRGDGEYLDGRRPSEVLFKQSIEEDLARRDFTINAMAYDPFADRLVDPFHGEADLQAKVIRAVGDPILRFTEDGLRAMRAVRFAAVLEFDLDPATFAAIEPTLHVTERVSIERIRDELVKMMKAPKPSLGFEWMRKSGLLKLVLPELLEGYGMAQNHHHAYDVYHHVLACIDAGSDLTARLGALFHDISKPQTQAPKEHKPGEHSFLMHESIGADRTDEIMRRLKFSNEQRERIVGLVRHHMFFYDNTWTDGTVRRFVSRVGEDLLEDLYNLRRADVVGHGLGKDPEAEIAPLKERISEVLAKSRAMKVTDLLIDGVDVQRELQIPPSRRIREVLDALLQRVLEDPSLNEREKLLEAVRAMRT